MNTPTDTQREVWRLALRCSQCPASNRCPHADCMRRYPSCMGGANECPRIPDVVPIVDAPTLSDVLDFAPSPFSLRFTCAGPGPTWAIGRRQVDWHASVLDFGDVLAMRVRWDRSASVWIVNGARDRITDWAEAMGAGVLD